MINGFNLMVIEKPADGVVHYRCVEESFGNLYVT